MPGKQKGGNKKAGRDKIKCQRYAQRQQKEKRALKHMLKSNRFEAAVEYARQHGLKPPQKPTKKIHGLPTQKELAGLIAEERIG